MKVLVAGWFSFEQMGASAGDLLARDLACTWLQRARCDYDVALAPPFTDGVSWRSVDPAHYSHVVFVCGPVGNGPPIDDLLRRFQDCKLIGLNLTMLQRLDEWNPFDLLLERDSSATARPDVCFLSPPRRVPVVGLVLIDTQPEYEENDVLNTANEALIALARSREMAVVRIDTRLDSNATGLRTPGEVESLIARMDLVLTTRLHGTVLAIKNGVPALIVDPVVGGAKVQRQAASIGWPICFTIETATAEALAGAYEFCLTEDARALARRCSRESAAQLEQVADRFISWVASAKRPSCIRSE